MHQGAGWAQQPARAGIPPADGEVIADRQERFAARLEVSALEPTGTGGQRAFLLSCGPVPQADDAGFVHGGERLAVHADGQNQTEGRITSPGPTGLARNGVPAADGAA